MPGPIVNLKIQNSFICLPTADTQYFVWRESNKNIDWSTGLDFARLPEETNTFKNAPRYSY